MTMGHRSGHQAQGPGPRSQRRAVRRAGRGGAAQGRRGMAGAQPQPSGCDRSTTARVHHEFKRSETMSRPRGARCPLPSGPSELPAESLAAGALSCVSLPLNSPPSCLGSRALSRAGSSLAAVCCAAADQAILLPCIQVGATVVQHSYSALWPRRVRYARLASGARGAPLTRITRSGLGPLARASSVCCPLWS